MANNSSVFTANASTLLKFESTVEIFAFITIESASVLLLAQLEIIRNIIAITSFLILKIQFEIIF